MIIFVVTRTFVADQSYYGCESTKFRMCSAGSDPPLQQLNDIQMSISCLHQQRTYRFPSLRPPAPIRRLFMLWSSVITGGVIVNSGLWVSTRFSSNVSKILPFYCGDKQQKLFEILKEMIISEPVLLIPRDNAPYRVESDSSDHAVGGVLSNLSMTNGVQ